MTKGKRITDLEKSLNEVKIKISDFFKTKRKERKKSLIKKLFKEKNAIKSDLVKVQVTYN